MCGGSDRHIALPGVKWRATYPCTGPAFLCITLKRSPVSLLAGGQITNELIDGTYHIRNVWRLLFPWYPSIGLQLCFGGRVGGLRVWKLVVHAGEAITLCRQARVWRVGGVRV